MSNAAVLSVMTGDSHGDWNGLFVLVQNNSKSHKGRVREKVRKRIG